MLRRSLSSHLFSNYLKELKVKHFSRPIAYKPPHWYYPSIYRFPRAAGISGRLWQKVSSPTIYTKGHWPFLKRRLHHFTSKDKYQIYVTHEEVHENGGSYVLKKTMARPKNAAPLSVIEFQDCQETVGLVHKEEKISKNPEKNKFQKKLKNLFDLAFSSSEITKVKKSYSDVLNSNTYNFKSSSNEETKISDEKTKLPDLTDEVTVSHSENTLIMNPFVPSKRKIFHFHNQNVHLIDFINFNDFNLAHQYIKEIHQSKNPLREGRMNFISFEKIPGSSKEIGTPKNQGDSNDIILQTLTSVPLQNAEKCWITDSTESPEPNDKTNATLRLSEVNDKDNITIVKVPIKKDNLTEETVVPDPSILNIINSVDKSTMIIQKDLYITDRMIKKIKEKEKKEKNKNENLKLMPKNLSFYIGLHSVGAQGENSIVLYDLDTYSNKVKEGAIDKESVHSFSLAWNSLLKGFSPTDIINKAKALIEKERYNQKKIDEKEKSAALPKKTIRQKPKVIPDDQKLTKFESSSPKRDSGHVSTLNDQPMPCKEPLFNFANDPEVCKEQMPRENKSHLTVDSILNDSSDQSYQTNVACLVGGPSMLLTFDQLNQNLPKSPETSQIDINKPEEVMQNEIFPSASNPPEVTKVFVFKNHEDVFLKEQETITDEYNVINNLENGKVNESQYESIAGEPCKNEITLMSSKKSGKGKKDDPNSGDKVNMKDKTVMPKGNNQNGSNKTGDHVIETNIKAIKKNGTTDITVSEKSTFVDPRLPMPFSTELVYQIFGTSNRLNEEGTLIENIRSILISSIISNVRNKKEIKKLDDHLRIKHTNIYKTRELKAHNEKLKDLEKYNIPKTPESKSQNEKIKDSENYDEISKKDFIETSAQEKKSDRKRATKRISRKLLKKLRSNPKASKYPRFQRAIKKMHQEIEQTEKTPNKIKEEPAKVENPSKPQPIEKKAESKPPKSQEEIDITEHESLTLRDRKILKELITEFPRKSNLDNKNSESTTAKKLTDPIKENKTKETNVVSENIEKQVKEVKVMPTKAEVKSSTSPKPDAENKNKNVTMTKSKHSDVHNKKTKHESNLQKETLETRRKTLEKSKPYSFKTSSLKTSASPTDSLKTFKGNALKNATAEPNAIKPVSKEDAKTKSASDLSKDISKPSLKVEKDEPRVIVSKSKVPSPSSLNKEPIPIVDSVEAATLEKSRKSDHAPSKLTAQDKASVNENKSLKKEESPAETEIKKSDPGKAPVNVSKLDTLSNEPSSKPVHVKTATQAESLKKALPTPETNVTDKKIEKASEKSNIAIELYTTDDSTEQQLSGETATLSTKSVSGQSPTPPPTNTSPLQDNNISPKELTPQPSKIQEKKSLKKPLTKNTALPVPGKAKRIELSFMKSKKIAKRKKSKDDILSLDAAKSKLSSALKLARAEPKENEKNAQASKTKIVVLESSPSILDPDVNPKEVLRKTLMDRVRSKMESKHPINFRARALKVKDSLKEVKKGSKEFSKMIRRKKIPNSAKMEGYTYKKGKVPPKLIKKVDKDTNKSYSLKVSKLKEKVSEDQIEAQKKKIETTNELMRKVRRHNEPEKSQSAQPVSVKSEKAPVDMANIEKAKPAIIEKAKPESEKAWQANIEKVKAANIEKPAPVITEKAKPINIEKAKPVNVEMAKPAITEKAKPITIEKPAPLSTDKSKLENVEKAKAVNIEKPVEVKKDLQKEPLKSEEKVNKPLEVSKEKGSDSEPLNVKKSTQIAPVEKKMELPLAESKIFVPQINQPEKDVETRAQQFPMLIVDLDKMAKEIKPDLDLSQCRESSVPFEQIKEFPRMNSRKSIQMLPTRSVIKVCPSKDPMLRRELKSLPSVTKVLNMTLPKVSKNTLKKWRKTMEKELGKNGFKSFYQEQMTKGSQFHNLIQDQLLWGNQGGEPSTLSFQSVRHVLNEMKQIAAINSCVIHKPLAYRGIVDCVAAYRNQPVVIEWKRLDHKDVMTKESLESSCLQIAAYIGAINFDTNYKFQVNRGMLVFAYSDGSKADVVNMMDKDCESYWKRWLERFEKYQSFVKSQKKKKPT